MRKFLVSFNFDSEGANGTGNIIVKSNGLTEDMVRSIEAGIREDKGFDVCVIISITELEG